MTYQISLLFLLLIPLIHGNYVQYCINSGKYYAENIDKQTNCQQYGDMEILTINPSCKDFFYIGCLRTMRWNQCTAGMENMKNISMADTVCNMKRKGVASDIYKECCDCCRLGRQQAEEASDLDCNIEMATKLCSKSYQTCCDKQKNQKKQEKQKENSNNKIPIISYDVIKTPNFFGECPRDHKCSHKCRMEYGRPHCFCSKGFELKSDGRTCTDINECQKVGCNPLYVCENTIGSYRCVRECPPGYELSPYGNECQDINECLTNEFKCDLGMICENVPGSYRCIREYSCGTGYVLNEDKTDCLDINECKLDMANCGDEYKCKNTIGSFKCIPKSCKKGYLMSGDRCEKIKCASGYRLNEMNGTCVDIDECEEMSPCRYINQKCTNTPGSYFCKTEVDCGTGMRFINEKCEDIDECLTGDNKCPKNSDCRNLYRSYTCECETGYEYDSIRNTCTDIDECSIYSDICGYNAKCSNLPGTYKCICNSGYENTPDGKECVDSDECKIPNICHHKCVNTKGSYFCVCNAGYYLDEVNKRTCIDIDECNQDGNKPCLGKCLNLPGSYKCYCPPGWELKGKNNDICVDVNECKRNRNTCATEEICLNTYGGHKCLEINCPPGYEMMTNNNRRCKRIELNCPPQDYDCLNSPVTYSYNFFSFPDDIKIPAELFAMRGPEGFRQNVEFQLKFLRAEDPITREQRAFRDNFYLEHSSEHEAAIKLVKPIKGPQDIYLEMNMRIYQHGRYSGTGTAKISLYVSKKDF